MQGIKDSLHPLGEDTETPMAKPLKSNVRTMRETPTSKWSPRHLAPPRSTPKFSKLQHKGFQTEAHTTEKGKKHKIKHRPSHTPEIESELTCNRMLEKKQGESTGDEPERKERWSDLNLLNNFLLRHDVEEEEGWAAEDGEDEGEEGLKSSPVCADASCRPYYFSSQLN